MLARFRGWSVGRRSAPGTGQKTPGKLEPYIHFSAPSVSWGFVPSGPAFFYTTFAKLTQRGPTILVQVQSHTLPRLSPQRGQCALRTRVHIQCQWLQLALCLFLHPLCLAQGSTDPSALPSTEACDLSMQFFQTHRPCICDKTQQKVQERLNLIVFVKIKNS